MAFPSRAAWSSVSVPSARMASTASRICRSSSACSKALCIRIPSCGAPARSRRPPRNSAAREPQPECGLCRGVLFEQNVLRFGVFRAARHGACELPEDVVLAPLVGRVAPFERADRRPVVLDADALQQQPADVRRAAPSAARRRAAIRPRASGPRTAGSRCQRGRSTSSR